MHTSILQFCGNNTLDKLLNEFSGDGLCMKEWENVNLLF
jgi:hypothetical protein